MAEATPLPHPLSRSPRPLRRGAALLPSLFTVANLGMGWYAIQQTILAVHSANPAAPLDNAAKAIGWAILLDGFDGRIARMVNAASDFGREFDSLADVISFGVAPAMLAYTWGSSFVSLGPVPGLYLTRAAHFISFLFLIAGAARLARFNIVSSDFKPTNPGRAGKRYFVGMPIPGAAGVVAAVVHFFTSPALGIGLPITVWEPAVVWLALVLLLSYCMVSTWRFYSFKDIDLRRRHPFVVTVMLAALLAGLWLFSEVVLLVLALSYLGFAVAWRASHHLRKAHAARI